jgi:hypothetical protein
MDSRTQSEPRSKPGRPPTRPVKTCDRALLHGGELVEIGTGRKTKQYHVTPAPADWGAAFTLVNRVTGEVYDVHFGPDAVTCSCPGHQWTNGCKHASALVRLVAEGRLFLPAPVDSIDLDALADGEARMLEGF